MQTVNEILIKLETADNTTKNQLENELVNLGTPVVPTLVKELQVIRGIKRGVVAMTLIRIGEGAVEHLLKAAKDNNEFKWVADYLITEIKGSEAA